MLSMHLGKIGEPIKQWWQKP